MAHSDHHMKTSATPVDKFITCLY